MADGINLLSEKQLELLALVPVALFWLCDDNETSYAA